MLKSAKRSIDNTEKNGLKVMDINTHTQTHTHTHTHIRYTQYNIGTTKTTE